MTYGEPEVEWECLGGGVAGELRSPVSSQLSWTHLDVILRQSLATDVEASRNTQGPTRTIRSSTAACERVAARVCEVPTPLAPVELRAQPLLDIPDLALPHNR